MKYIIVALIIFFVVLPLIGKSREKPYQKFSYIECTVEGFFTTLIMIVGCGVFYYFLNSLIFVAIDIFK